MKHYLILFYGWLLELYRKPLMWSEATMKLIYMPGFPKLRAYNGKVRGYTEFIRAKKNVPAYRAFLKANNFNKPSFTGFIPNTQEIPPTDKENYVKMYTMDARCVGGVLPTRGLIIDESSGSSGKATNWARGQKERSRNAKLIKFGLRNLIGKDPIFIINAFALGPWATGTNVTMSCASFSKLKSIGPDFTKIENTLKGFGPDHHYVIMGYPPFLKLLVDNAQIDWNSYHVSLIFGGESMSEGMRDYLYSKGIKKVYSSLGASDLELNICSENDYTIGLRRLMRENALLREKIVKYTGALPMVFQYNPADFLIEPSSQGEMVITICRPGYIAPKIRYNLHDRGQIMGMKELEYILKELGISASALPKPRIDLPFLFHYGRADSTVSFFGSNIGPTDVGEAIYNLPSLASAINSFSIATPEDDEGNKTLIISLENLKTGDPTLPDLEELRISLYDQLASVNQDFREARKMASLPHQTQIKMYSFGEGPFATNDIRIKAKYFG